jgi:hypothetical protein
MAIKTKDHITSGKTECVIFDEAALAVSDINHPHIWNILGEMFDLPSMITVRIVIQNQKFCVLWKILVYSDGLTREKNTIIVRMGCH